MSMHQDNCPTCGARLGALARVELRTCQGCRRQNPAGFLYCGYCAAPMEVDDLRTRSAEVPAPEGGWPNLESELVEVRFFLAQGQLDEAYDHLSTLQARHPGHPELADFAQSANERRGPEPDEDVETLVDSVLAESSTLSGKAPRRRAVPWDAPTSDPVVRRGRKLTTAHEVVQLALAEEFFDDDDDDEPATLPRAKVVVADYAKRERAPRKVVPKVERTNVFDAVPPRPAPRMKLRKPPVRHPVAAPQAAVAKVKPVKRAVPRTAQPAAKMPPVRAGEPAAQRATFEPERSSEPQRSSEPPRSSEPQHTVAVDALQPAAPFSDEAKHTMAVDALQPAAPFDGQVPEAFEARKEQIKRATSKTGRRRRVAPASKGKEGRTRDRYAAAARRDAEQNREARAGEDEASEGPSKARGTAFGAGVLARFGR